MSGADYADACSRFVRMLLVRAVLALSLVAIVATASHMGWTPVGGINAEPFRQLARLVAVVAGLVTIAISGLIVFDALLFRLMANWRDDETGGRAVDDLLTRMRLKPAPERTRSLAERQSGTRRLLRLQGWAAAVFVATSATALLS